MKNEKHSQIKKDYIWNTINSITTAIISPIIILVLTRFQGISAAGEYSIAFATANVLFIIASYNIINFQITDVNINFNFSEYLYSKIPACTVMIAISIVYLYFNNSTPKNLIVTFSICIFRMIDAISEIYQGEYQRQKRLDIASQLGFFRQIISNFVVILIIIFSKNMFLAHSVGIVLKIGIIFIVNRYSDIQQKFESNQVDKKNVATLFITCFPLFLSAFFSSYISNSPKFAIEKYFPETIQGEFSIVLLPILVVYLLSNFIYHPLLTGLSTKWNHREYSSVKKSIIYTVIATFALTLITTVAGYFLGIPLLSFIYGIKLDQYKLDMVFIILSGGCIAISTFFSYIVIIFRTQHLLILSSGIASILLFFLLPLSASGLKTINISIMYLIIMLFQSIIMGIFIIKSFVNAKKLI